MSAPWGVEILADEPKTPTEGEAKEWSISPSATNTWLECERKWGFRYIGKLYAPPADSALLGTDGHAQAQAYLDKGKPLDFSRPSGAIMQAGQHLWPTPGTRGMQLERKFRFQSTRTGFIYSGFKDIEIAPGALVPSLGFDGAAPIVIDHKTTSSIEKYAKTLDELEYDPQATIYGLDAMARFSSLFVDLGWIYYQTKGSKRSHTVTLRGTLEHTLKCFDAIEAEAQKMAKAREDFAASSQQAEPLAFVKENLKANPAACGAYGGCPYQHICNLSPVQRMRSKVSMSLIASLKSRVQGVTMSEAPATPPTPAPEPIFGDPTQVPAPPENEIPPAFRADPINPPESKLPPPPLALVTAPPTAEPSTESKPRGRGRPAGAKNKPKDEPAADAPPGVTITEHVVTAASGVPPELAAQLNAAGVDVQRVLDHVEAAMSKSMHLYVDCLPDGGSFVTYADVLVAKANAKIVAGGQVAHYKFLKFGEAAGALAIALEEVLNDEKPSAVFCNATSEALPVLTARATVITRSVR